MPTITDFTREKILYVDDFGNNHAVSERVAVATAAGNTASSSPGDPGRPSRWKLRHIQCVYIDPGTGHVFRKRVVIGQITNPLWTGASNSINVDGVTWTVEGRIGEKRAV